MELAESLSLELKQKLTLAELETLTAIFRNHENGGAVEAGSFNALREALTQKYGAPEAFTKAFSSSKKSSLSFADVVNVSTLSLKRKEIQYRQ